MKMKPLELEAYLLATYPEDEVLAKHFEAVREAKASAPKALEITATRDALEEALTEIPQLPREIAAIAGVSASKAASNLPRLVEEGRAKLVWMEVKGSGMRRFYTQAD